MQVKYLYILLSLIILGLSIILFSYLRRPRLIINDEVLLQQEYNEAKKTIKQNDIKIKSIEGSLDTLYDSVAYYKARIEANELKLKRIQKKKNEAPTQLNFNDGWTDNDYTKFLSDRYTTK